MHYKVCYALFISFLLLLFYACSYPNNTQQIHESENVMIDEINPLYKPYAKELSQNKNGAIIIDNEYSALFHRLALIDMATKSIYIQTYIYKSDFTSHLLLYALYRAAQRGVKIRILIDDNGINSDFKEIATLDNHKNIEIKIFNPYYFRYKILRMFEIPFNFSRINRRMHNKMFLFDNTALIVGGRNMGNNYFGFSDVNFTDLDILFIGSAAIFAKNNFDEFWNYSKSVALSEFLDTSKEKYDISKIKNIPSRLLGAYQKHSEFFKKQYENKEIDISWGNATFLSDRPLKIEIKPERVDSIILDTLTYYLNKAKTSIDISSAYLVPGVPNTDLWKDIAKKGVKISILTNSLSSIDVVPVYSHWEKYRKELSLSGIKIYEYASMLSKAKLKDKAKLLSTRKAKVSLHSKNIVIDEDIVAVGSFNLDYRSSNLNTENMVFFKSSNLAKKLKKVLESEMKDAYKIHYKNEKCYWERIDDDGKKEEFKKSPHTSIWLRIYKNLAKIIPEKEV